MEIFANLLLSGKNRYTRRKDAHHLFVFSYNKCEKKKPLKIVSSVFQNGMCIVAFKIPFFMK